MLGVYKVSETAATSSTTANEVDTQSAAAAEDAAVTEEQGVDYLVVGAVVGAVNLLLILIGVGAWWLFGRSKKVPDALNLAEEGQASD